MNRNEFNGPFYRSNNSKIQLFFCFSNQESHEQTVVDDGNNNGINKGWENRAQNWSAPLGE